jgi:hypothetical protein
MKLEITHWHFIITIIFKSPIFYKLKFHVSNIIMFLKYKKIVCELVVNAYGGIICVTLHVRNKC